MRARLMYTFGLSIAEIDGLYFEDAAGFVEEGEALERSHYKMLSVVASYPHMKESDRRSTWRKFDSPQKTRRTLKVNYSEGYKRGV